MKLKGCRGTFEGDKLTFIYALTVIIIVVCMSLLAVYVVVATSMECYTNVILYTQCYC